jgi:hypothetical protein
VKLEPESVRGLSEAEDRAAWVFWKWLRPTSPHEVDLDATLQICGELDGGGDWAECRDLWASAGARNIVGFVQKKAKSPMATSLPSAKLRARERRRSWRVSGPSRLPCPREYRHRYGLPGRLDLEWGF